MNSQAGIVEEEEREFCYIFLLNSALFAVVGIRDSRPATDGASSLVGAVVALITDANQSAWSYV